MSSGKNSQPWRAQEPPGETRCCRASAIVGVKAMAPGRDVRVAALLVRARRGGGCACRCHQPWLSPAKTPAEDAGGPVVPGGRVGRSAGGRRRGPRKPNWVTEHPEQRGQRRAATRSPRAARRRPTSSGERRDRAAMRRPVVGVAASHEAALPDRRGQLRVGARRGRAGRRRAPGTARGSGAALSSNAIWAIGCDRRQGSRTTCAFHGSRPGKQREALRGTARLSTLPPIAATDAARRLEAAVEWFLGRSPRPLRLPLVCARPAPRHPRRGLPRTRPRRASGPRSSAPPPTDLSREPRRHGSRVKGGHLAAPRSTPRAGEARFTATPALPKSLPLLPRRLPRPAPVAARRRQRTTAAGPGSS